MTNLLRTAKVALPVLAIALFGAAWFALNGGDASSQQPSPPAFDTVSNVILASHGIELQRDADRGPAAPVTAPTEAIKEALRQMALPAEFAEPPRRVRFKRPIPGIEVTDGRQVWAVALTGNIQFSGGPRGFVPHPQSKGTYVVAFFSEATGKIEYAVAGERVLD